MPTIHLRPRTLRRRLTLVGLGAIAAAGILSMPPAHADSRVDQYAATNANRVCFVLTNFPTFTGIEGIADAIVSDGFTYEQAGAIEMKSVLSLCPEHLRLWQDFIAVYSSPAPISDAYAS